MAASDGMSSSLTPSGTFDASLMDKATFGEARLSKEMEADISTVQLGGSYTVVSQAKKMWSRAFDTICRMFAFTELALLAVVHG